jgi:Tol biopolymer transport system component
MRSCVRLWTLLAIACAALVPGADTVASPGSTERVSVDSAGTEGDGGSSLPAISADGRYVAFESVATNLLPNATNVCYDSHGRQYNCTDVLVYDRQTRLIEQANVDGAGNQANNWTNLPSVSADGRYVAFQSDAANLVPGDTNGQRDIFVHDRDTGAMERVSVDAEGNEGNADSYFAAISTDGGFVAFASFASNLVSGDTNSADMFVHNRVTRDTDRVSVDSSGNEANHVSETVAVSGDGRYVAFGSWASNLVPGDTNGTWDVFVRDRETGVTERASVSTAGGQSDGESYRPAISVDGRYVAFESMASNLVPGDTNGTWDVFVRDRQALTTERVSVDSAGNQGDGGSAGASVSGYGRYVAFVSNASNLVDGDTNICGTPPFTYNCQDIFAHDRRGRVTARASVDSGDGQANGISGNPSISADGRYVAFESEATNLVMGDTNGVEDIFVHDLGDADADGEWDPFDNCPLEPNPDQTDTDGDSQGDACDADDDNDTIADTADNCALVANPGQEDRDVPSNGIGDHCEDADSDAFTDYVEVYVATDPDDACPDSTGDDAWPLDINIDRSVTIVGDVLAYSGNISKSVAQHPELQRLDLNGDRSISIVGDVLFFAGNLGRGCN